MERPQKNATDTLGALVPLFSELIPLLLDKWSEIRNRPSIRELQRGQVRLGRRIKQMLRELRWYRALFFVLLIWNIILTVFLYIK
jgi:hypothetical protein